MDFHAWINTAYPSYCRLTQTARDITEQLLTDNSVDYLGVTCRTKSKGGILEKIKRKGYHSPQSQMTDISGIRIVTYFLHQADVVAKLIADNFNVDKKNSLDKFTLLGIDRLGYRSLHFVCDLGRDRCRLAEHRSLSEMKFEIQVRTVLQHAWAELAHDRSYKFSAGLPAAIERKLNLYAGLLEISDTGFQEISKEIDQYESALKQKGTAALVTSEINSLSLTRLLELRGCDFSFKVEPQNSSMLSYVLDEFREFGVDTIGDVDKLLSKEFIRAANKHLRHTSYVGLLRDAMMFNDLEKYMRLCWPIHPWSVASFYTADLLSERFSRAQVESTFEKKQIHLEELDV